MLRVWETMGSVQDVWGFGEMLLVYLWIVLRFYPLKVLGLCSATAKLSRRLHYLLQDYRRAGEFSRCSDGFCRALRHYV